MVPYSQTTLHKLHRLPRPFSTGFGRSEWQGKTLQLPESNHNSGPGSMGNDTEGQNFFFRSRTNFSRNAGSTCLEKLLLCLRAEQVRRYGHGESTVLQRVVRIATT